MAKFNIAIISTAKPKPPTLAERIRKILGK